MWSKNFYRSFFKNIFLYMSSRLSKIRPEHTYAMPRTVYFGWICKAFVYLYSFFCTRYSLMYKLTSKLLCINLQLVIYSIHSIHSIQSFPYVCIPKTFMNNALQCTFSNKWKRRNPIDDDSTFCTGWGKDMETKNICLFWELTLNIPYSLG